MTSYSHVYTAGRYPLEGIDLFGVQATKISFKNKKENPDSFLEQVHVFAGQLRLASKGRVGPVWVLKS